MSKIKTGITFFAGLAIGGAAAWYYARAKYAALAEQEIESVKEAYAQRARQAKNELAEADPVSSPTVLNSNKIREKGSIAEYARRVQQDDGYTDYSKMVEQIKNAPAQTDTASDEDVEAPYVISPDEFGEIDGYAKVSLAYFSDGVLSDEYGVIVDDPEEIIGDGLEHFGDYEEDAVHVRSDTRRSDYEILREIRTYADFRKTLPPNI